MAFPNIGKRREWRLVRDFFEKNPSEMKRSRKNSGLSCSYVNIENKIYAITNLHKNPRGFLGQGGFSKVKIAQDINGAQYAVRISKV